MNLEQLHLRDKLAQVERDLVEVDLQVAAGELDEATAARLRSTYEVEADELQARLADQPAEAAPAAGRSRRRTLAGAVVLLVGAAAVTVALSQAIQDRPPGGLATGGIVSDVVGGGVRDLSAVTNEELEAVVAANPDVVPMRLALARRYFEGGEFDRALPHYLEVLDREQHPEALANVGWMTYLSDRPDVAVSLVERALATLPDYPQASWYLANIRLYGLDDPGSAIEPLEAVLATPDLPADIRREAEAMLAVAREGS